MPLSSEDEPVIPPPLRKVARKVKASSAVLSASTPVPPSLSYHVSVSLFPSNNLYPTDPVPIVGWLKTSIGFDNLVIYLTNSSLYHRSLFKPQ
jgi:hypothetical protein